MIPSAVLLTRIAAVLVAGVLYLLVWYLLTLLLFALATVFSFDVPWYHEVPPAWWGWVWSVIWVGGLIVTAWWVGFRLPWWRRDRAST